MLKLQFFSKILIVLFSFFLLGCQSAHLSKASDSHPQVKNSNIVINPIFDGAWIGNGISYSPYRDGESPLEGSITSKEHILEDLKLISKNWNLIRMYGAGEVSERVLEVISENKLPIKVFQGAWLSSSQTLQQNDNEVFNAIRLAKKYPDIVIAVSVGNEALVDWSAHKFDDVRIVIEYVRIVKAAIKQPVTVFDDYNFWNKPWAKQLAKEVDFIGLHAYAFWNNIPLEESLQWTQNIHEDIQKRFPNMQLVMGETGWPTSRIYNDGSYEGGLIGIASVENLKTFFNKYNQWINRQSIVSFYFEAFDEKWKGGDDGVNAADKAEKHWGVYYSNRKPKIELAN